MQQQRGDHVGLGMAHLATQHLLVKPDLAQHIAQAIPRARELDGVGIGQELALACHGRLQQATCAPAQPAHRGEH